MENTVSIKENLRGVKLAKMRTAAGLYEELRKLDPETDVSQTYIYRLIRAGILPTRQSGKKKLVDLDIFLAYLAGEYEPTEPEQSKQLPREII